MRIFLPISLYMSENQRDVFFLISVTQLIVIAVLPNIKQAECVLLFNGQLKNRIEIFDFSKYSALQLVFDSLTRNPHKEKMKAPIVQELIMLSIFLL